MKKLLFLGGVGGMAYATRIARSEGYEVVVVDYFEDSQAKQFANKSYLLSTLDLGSLKNLVLKENIQGIFTGFSDNNIRSASYLCETFNFPLYINSNQLNMLQDKNEFKKMCDKYGISTPKQYVDLDRVSFPVIVKPSDSYASKGITVCNNDSELVAAIKEAKKYSRNGEVLIEDYLAGNEIMIHFVMLNKRLKITSAYHRVLATSFVDEKKAIAPLLTYNVDEYAYLSLKYEETLERMFIDLGFENIVGFLQGIKHNDKIYFFEPAVRFGGNASEIFNASCNGVDIIKKFIDYSCSGKMEDYDIDKINPFFGSFCCTITLFMRSGKIKNIMGEEKVYRIPGVIDVHRYAHLNDVIEKNKENTWSAVAYRIHVKLLNKEHLFNIIDDIRNVLTVNDEYDNNMIEWDKYYNIKLVG